MVNPFGGIGQGQAIVKLLDTHGRLTLGKYFN